LFTYSWRSKTGTLRNIRNEEHINRALEHAIANKSDELVLHCHTDLLFFDHLFAGVNLDEVDTTSFPTPPPMPAAPDTPAVTPTIGTSHLPVVPSTSILNYNALPSDVLVRYENFQDPNLIVPVQDPIPFVDSISTPIQFYANPFVIGTRVIL
jgi:hypothetical protein